MNIIILGCDKTGKTTLAKHLQRLFGFKYIKVNKPLTDNPTKLYLNMLLSTKDGNYILDRFHIGLNVYGPIYRHTAPIDLIDILNLLIKNNDIVILCYDDIHNILKKFIQLNELFAKIEDILKIVTRFFYYASYSILPVIYFNMNFKYELMSNFNMTLKQLVLNRKR